MNVLLISQCDKRALNESRRIIDQFAERRGERTWQTSITQIGLDTLRRMLRKTARKNTAVACHWVRGRDHSELLWIVGDIGQFNVQGAVPTNTTARDVLRKHDENDWHSSEDIRLLAILAALFHDIGKASKAFQAKLKSKSSQPMRDAYRHEWVSLRLFEAFVGKDNDEGWLQRLAALPDTANLAWLSHLARDDASSPFKKGRLPPLAQAVGWLIVSHHRLPGPQKDATGQQFGREGFEFLPAAIFADWNDANPDAKATEKAACWTFNEAGLPFASRDWCRRTRDCAKAMLARNGFIAKGSEFLTDPYIMHLARLTLMLADHHYSSLPSNARFGDAEFPTFANTDRKTGTLKQRLDEHLIGVAVHARKIMGTLPRLEHQLPRIARHKGFKRRAEHDAFRWQDKAFDLAIGVQKRAQQQGFFGINMASTGCGKTLANGRILYGLSDPQRGARFTIALGLRTLTLQTGQAYRKRLDLGEDDLAVLVGGGAVRELYEAGKQDENLAQHGSESAQGLLPDNSYVHFDASLDEGPLQLWLGSNSGANTLLNAPIVTCTVDHLMPATESTRGGHQIAPILRLMTSDLVLDEIDEFDMDDLPALTRLVHWAGVFGSRVLLSSATLPPALLRGLFDAYREGRQIFQRHRGEGRSNPGICCAWFDEYVSTTTELDNTNDFASAHMAFIDKRLRKLREAEVRRVAAIRSFTAPDKTRSDICKALATALPSWISELHDHHHSLDPASGKRVSFGLVRFANIGPLIEVAEALYAAGAPEGVRLHLCVYHSRHPLLMRSEIEAHLDRLLQRHDASGNGHDPLLDQPLIKEALQRFDEPEQIFVVLALPVAEIGRDHDYDWAIVEPSSMRSIIQLAGRIRRHRRGRCLQPNIYLLERNLKSMEGVSPAYCRPGFENSDYLLVHHGLCELLAPEQIAIIDAAARIIERAPLHPRHNLVDLEHHRLRALMLDEGAPLPVTLWWQTPAHLCAVLQTRQRFRAGLVEQTYALLLDAQDESRAHFHRDDDGDWTRVDNLLTWTELTPGPRIGFWPNTDYLDTLNALATLLDKEPDYCAKRFGSVQLREQTNGWLYHPALGFQEK